MTKVLAERNLPVEFTDFLIAEDNEKTLERIKTFEKKYKKAIEDAVNEKLKGKHRQQVADNLPMSVSQSKTALCKQFMTIKLKDNRRN